MKCPRPAPVLLVVLLCACASSPPARFYTLHAQRGDGAQAQPAAAGDAPRVHMFDAATLSIVIDEVRVPEIVDRQQMVLRTGPAEVRVDEFARWAEPLKQQIAGVLAADLARTFPGGVVSTSPQWAGQEQSFHVSVDVQTFESAQGRAATIVALWTVRPPDGAAPGRGLTTIQESVRGQDYEALVDAHSRALANVSADIAQVIAALNRAPASPRRRPPS
ncbi:hypothetical protein CAL12_22265 [Bordetella genomosp. 8]|uniref:ABC-type transport auxiliary lipoprotein component domain-containing protein n=1 Tax=Bordetella genomosp. 8 TaxID=1416806 RepID=A0A1W6YQI3_9BORD|nr:PqiC family protein [Bordetella genomosp. 8]ARP83274.1 hypothetical protein CAL12_22265 [Bordetella genomosp. 8]